MEARIKIIAWNAKEQMQASKLGSLLLSTVWDFTQFDKEKDTSQRMHLIKEYAAGLKAVCHAADQVGVIEHTNDWDPILIITLRNGEKVESESHYY